MTLPPPRATCQAFGATRYSKLSSVYSPEMRTRDKTVGSSPDTPDRCRS